MNQAEYDRVSGELMAAAQQIELAKRPGYTMGDEDVLANFKRVSERAGISPEQAWAVYFLKHVDAIVAMMTRPDLPVAEAAEGRFSDAINYLRLGHGLLRERDGIPAMGMNAPCEGMTEIPHGDGFGYTVPPSAKMGRLKC